MEVDREKQHYECTKCGNVVSMFNYSNNKNNLCSEGGRCNWKKNLVSWNKSALGSTVNLVFGKSSGESAPDKKENIQTRLNKQRERGDSGLLKKYWWAIIIVLGFVLYKATFTKQNKKTTKHIVSAKPNEESLNNETTYETEKKENILSNSNNTFEGTWNGSFGKDQLTIVIESIDANGVVKGYDEVRGNKRTLTGSLIESEGRTQFVLNEPGDDEWDGEFIMEFDKSSSTISGEWRSNNGKSKKNFSLIKN